MKQLHLETVVVLALGVALIVLIISAVVLAALRVPVPSEISGSIPVVIGGFVGALRFAQPSSGSDSKPNDDQVSGIKAVERQ